MRMSPFSDVSSFVVNSLMFAALAIYAQGLQNQPPVTPPTSPVTTATSAPTQHNATATAPAPAAATTPTPTPAPTVQPTLPQKSIIRPPGGEYEYGDD